MTDPPRGFIGRASELADLRRALERAADGFGGFVTVIGEAGIGKTSLIREATASQGCTTCWAVARADFGAPPLWAWTQLSRSAAAAGRPAMYEALSEPLPRSSMVGTGHDRFLLFDRICRALTEADRGSPLALVLDDLQWVDADSRDLLSFVAAELSGSRVTIISSVRADEVVVLPRSDLTLELAGLTPADLRLMITGITGDDIGEELSVEICEQTSGNPFFATELARLLRSTGRGFAGTEWRTTLPEGVRTVLRRRFARLSESTYEPLCVAAVVGLTFDPDVVGALSGSDGTDVRSRLAPAVDAGLVHATLDGQLAFEHALVREAALADLGSERREALHQRCARVLEIAGAPAAQIASHLLSTGDRGEVSHWAAEAGRQAFDAARYADATAWFERAALACDDTDADLLVLLGDSRARSGQPVSADEAYLRATVVARRSGNADVLVRAALGLGAIGGPFEVRLLTPSHLALLHEALQAVGPSDSPERAVLLARLSVASTLTEDAQVRAEMAEDALAMARRTADPAAMVVAAAAWCDAHAGPRDADRRPAIVAEMLQSTAHAEDPELELVARRLSIVNHLEHGEISRAEVQVSAFARLADTLRQPRFTWYARIAEASMALGVGDLDRAERLALQARTDGQAAGSANAAMLSDGAVRAVIARERRDFASMRRHFSVNDLHPEAARVSGLLTLFTAGRDGDQAAIEKTVANFPPVESVVSAEDSTYLLAMATLADGASVVGNLDRLAEAEAALAPYPDLFVLDGMGSVNYGPVSWKLARIALGRGDTKQAIEWYDRTARTLGRSGATYLQEQATLERARVEAGEGWHLAAPPPEPGVATRSPGPVGRFRREGDTWEISFDQRSTRLRHRKGMGDLAVLLARPDRELHVLDLIAASEGHPAKGRQATGGDLGPMLDRAARASYEQRIRDVSEEIEAAEAINDDSRAADLDDERAMLLEQLSGSLGMGHRDRPQRSDAERARKAVSMRIADSLESIDRQLPALGRHLRNSIRTGAFCCYRPERPTDWEL